MPSKLSDLKEQWKENILKPVLARFPERGERFETGSGIEVKRFLIA